MGSGWLIQPDLLVAPGHVTFDYETKLGKAVLIKAYVGYDGRKSVGAPGVQDRNGVRCVTPAEWLLRKNAEQSDVSFIKLDKPFTDIPPLGFKTAPGSGAGALGVVGYPGDHAQEGGIGALTYETFATVGE